MKQINSNNEEEIQTAVTGQIEKISSITDKNDIKENRANSVEKILFMYATAVSDVGTVRSNNQDSAFAGEHLAAICDGMGGHAGGDTASTIAIRSLAHIEQDSRPHDVKTVSSMMETSIMAAHDAIVGKAKRERRLAGMGTTVTAVTLVRGYWVLAHLGDSRAYLLRDNHLMRMTTDHSYVQHLIDTGHITPEEARNHPQRNVVMRVLGDFDIDP
ncbi:phosphoprotein phosphatase, partial [Bifidobacteriaceae bacterium WP022]